MDANFKMSEDGLNENFRKAVGNLYGVGYPEQLMIYTKGNEKATFNR